MWREGGREGWAGEPCELCNTAVQLECPQALAWHRPACKPRLRALPAPTHPPAATPCPRTPAHQQHGQPARQEEEEEEQHAGGRKHKAHRRAPADRHGGQLAAGGAFLGRGGARLAAASLCVPGPQPARDHCSGCHEPARCTGKRERRSHGSWGRPRSQARTSRKGKGKGEGDAHQRQSRF